MSYPYQLVLVTVFFLSLCSCQKTGDLYSPKSLPGNTVKDITAAVSAGSVNVISDWETHDLSQWDGIRCHDCAAQFSTVNAPVRQGSYAARFVVHPNDIIPGISGERCEVAHVNDIVHGYTPEKVDDDFYYGWSTLLPSDWTNPNIWGIFMQWHAQTSFSPPIAFNIDHDTIEVNLRGGLISGTKENHTFGCAKTYKLLTTLNKGLWHDFIVHVKFRPDNAGILEVWHRLEGDSAFVQLLSVSNVPTLHYTTNLSFIAQGAQRSFGNGYTTDCYVQHGLYRGPGGKNTNTIYHDNWIRATSYATIQSSFGKKP